MSKQISIVCSLYQEAFHLIPRGYKILPKKTVYGFFYAELNHISQTSSLHINLCTSYYN